MSPQIGSLLSPSQMEKLLSTEHLFNIPFLQLPIHLPSRKVMVENDFFIQSREGYSWVGTLSERTQNWKNGTLSSSFFEEFLHDDDFPSSSSTYFKTGIEFNWKRDCISSVIWKTKHDGNWRIELSVTLKPLSVSFLDVNFWSLSWLSCRVLPFPGIEWIEKPSF